MVRIHVTVRLFALAKERAGRSEIELELPAKSTVADLRRALRDRFPELAALWSSALVAVDEEYAGDDVPIGPGTTLAVIPPVSGGTRTCRGALSLPAWSKETDHR